MAAVLREGRARERRAEADTDEGQTGGCQPVQGYEKPRYEDHDAHQTDEGPARDRAATGRSEVAVTWVIVSRILMIDASTPRPPDHRSGAGLGVTPQFRAQNSPIK